MAQRAFALIVLTAAAGAEVVSRAQLEAQAKALRELIAASPRLPLQRAMVPVAPAGVDWAMDMVSSVAVDKAGLIYAFQRGPKADPVVVVDKSGKVVRSFGRGLYKIPHSVRIDPQGSVWTVDANSSMVYKHSPDGAKLLEISVGGQPANHRSEFRGTTDICFAPGGRIFISDGYANARLLEYTGEGQKVREWGKPGKGPGEFHLPHGIAVDREGTLYVADRENGRIQRFNLEGKFLGEWNHLGKTFSITVTAAGDLWIGTQPRTSPNTAAGWIVKLDRKTGKVLGYVDSPGLHSVDQIAPGEPVTGARPDDILWFRPIRK
jgi:DNA-binding beta-propeller fold protein YncE